MYVKNLSLLINPQNPNLRRNVSRHRLLLARRSLMQYSDGLQVQGHRKSHLNRDMRTLIIATIIELQYLAETTLPHLLKRTIFS